MTTKSSLPLMLLRTSFWAWEPLGSVWYLEKVTLFGRTLSRPMPNVLRTLGCRKTVVVALASLCEASYSR